MGLGIYLQPVYWMHQRHGADRHVHVGPRTERKEKKFKKKREKKEKISKSVCTWLETHPLPPYCRRYHPKADAYRGNFLYWKVKDLKKGQKLWDENTHLSSSTKGQYIL